MPTPATHPFLPATSETSRIRLLGHLYGAYYKKQVLSASQTLVELERRRHDEAQLIDLLKFTVGSFTLLVEEEDRYRVYTSPNTQGCFLLLGEGRPSIFTSEREAFTEALRRGQFNLNKFELLETVLPDWAAGSPLSTLSDHCQRIPGGFAGEIPKNSNQKFKGYTYLLQTPEEAEEGLFEHSEASYQEFVDRLEGTVRVIHQALPDLRVLFSGGVDSACVAIAAKKIDANPQLIGTSQNGTANSYDCFGEWSAIEVVGQKLGLDVEVLIIDRYSADLRAFRQEAIKWSFTSMCRWDSWTPLLALKHLSEREEKPVALLGGEYMDTGLGIGHTKIGTNFSFYDFKLYAANNPGKFKNQLKSYLKARWPHVQRRFAFTKFYQQGLTNENKLWQRIAKKYRKSNQSNFRYSACLEYIFSTMMLSYVDNAFLPIIRSGKTLPHFLRNLEPEYLEYKAERFLKQVIPPALLAQLQANDISSVALNHIFRVANYYLYMTSYPRHYDNLNRLTDVRFIAVPFEGPMLNFFFNYRCGLEALQIAKGFLYRYFKEHTGFDYMAFRYQHDRKAVLAEKQRIPTPIGHLEPVNANAGNIRYLSSRAEVEDVLLRLYNEPIVLRQFLKPSCPVSEYIEGLLFELEHGVGNLEYHQLARLYNLEMFLRNVVHEAGQTALN
ncbi:MAG TPA: hypothetical protein V6C99_12290 [Oculatellaceae cyanobacterium]